MKIIWNPNPLATVVQLDDHDKRVLRLRLEIEDLTERIGSARFDLAPDTREWHNKHVGARTLDESVASALRYLDAEHTTVAELDARLADYVTELSGVHCGDCTCIPCSCLKCHAESLLGIDTIPGLGKHEASYIGGAFTPNDGPPRTLDEAIAHLGDYEPQNVPEWGAPHVDRWRGEAKRAHEWLVAYRREHFVDPEPEERGRG